MHTQVHKRITHESVLLFIMARSSLCLAFYFFYPLLVRFVLLSKIRKLVILSLHFYQKKIIMKLIMCMHEHVYRTIYMFSNKESALNFMVINTPMQIFIICYNLYILVLLII